LAIKFWGDFVSTVTLIINRTISQVLKGKFHFEELPLFADFKVFGCLLYLNITTNSHKELTRASLLAARGYKVYKVYELFTRSLHISRYALLHEDTFPFQSLPHLTTPRVPLSNVVLPNPIPYHSFRPTTVPNIEPDHEPHVINPSPDTITYWTST